ncbi:hypothetical protein CRG98_040630, partial [Punica granatum]
ESGKWKPKKVGRSGRLISHHMFADDLILFAEASVPQMKFICNILDHFCATAGQKVSSFTAAPTKGKYLFIPIIHGRVRRDHFRHVVNRVQARLSGWAATSLYFDGWVTPAIWVIHAIPSFSMQVLKFPTGVCQEIDRLSRNFIWGHISDRRRIHLIDWNTLTQPCEHGGLGFSLSRVI